MIVVVIIGILAAVAIPNFVSLKSRSIDATMKSDLHNAMVALEDYNLMNGTYPSDAATFEASLGFQLSPDVTWDKFDLAPKDGITSVHMHLTHPQSSNNWHAHYPAEGNNIEIR